MRQSGRVASSLLLALSCSVSVALSAAGEAEWAKSTKAWKKAQHQKAIAVLSSGIAKCEKGDQVKEKNYNLLHLQRGLFYQYLGEIGKAQDDLWVAYAHSDVDKTDALKVKEFIFADAHNQYKLAKREECFLHFILGLNELMLGSPDRALVELKKVKWIGAGEQKIEEELPDADLVRGVAHMRLRENDAAAVSIRKCLQQRPDFAPGYLLLARVLELDPTLAMGTEETPESLMERYRELTQSDPAPTDSDFIIIGVPPGGKGGRQELELCGRNIPVAPYVLGGLQPGFTAREFWGEFGKEMARHATREVLNQLTFGIAGMFVGGEENRTWYEVPQYFIMVPVSKGQEIGKISLFGLNSKGARIKKGSFGTIWRPRVDSGGLSFVLIGKEGK